MLYEATRILNSVFEEVISRLVETELCQEDREVEEVEVS